MKSFADKFPVVAHIGNQVSHSKIRTKRPFKHNLHTVTVAVNGAKQRFRVPTKVLKLFKKQGITTHWQKPQS